MFAYQNFTLSNGLRVIVHPVPQCQIAAINLMYHVGSRNETPDKTGLAHFFEHLMFGPSKHIKAYDKALHKVGGTNNAYTSLDVTSYHCTLPAANLETVFWLESDRMLALAHDPKVLEVQRKVVIEEFKQTTLNQPYGDCWHHLLNNAYTRHTYGWSVIGKDISHIQEFTMDDVKNFANQFYSPNNAVLAVAGGVDPHKVEHLAKKWFEPLPPSTHTLPTPPEEPTQKAPRHHTITAQVPANALYKAYHMPGIRHQDYKTINLLATLLGQGKSSLLYQQLAEEQRLFSEITAYTLQTMDPGLLIIEGKLHEGVPFSQAQEALQVALKQVCTQPLPKETLEKAKTQLQAAFFFEHKHLTKRVETLALSLLLGKPTFFYDQLEQLAHITPKNLQEIAAKILGPDNCTTLQYKSL